MKAIKVPGAVKHTFPTIVVDKINLMTELPDDFVMITRVWREGYGQIPYLEVNRYPFNKEGFTISGNKVYFSVTYSRWYFIKLWQKFQESRNPIKYTIEYVNVGLYEKIMKENNGKLPYSKDTPT